MNRISPASRHREGAGFTLIEILSVVTIATILIASLVPAFNTISQGNLLTASGNQMVNLANYARQNSMAKNAMTALVIVTDPTNEARNRSATLFELVPKNNGTQPTTTDWKQVTSWTTLKAGTFIDPPSSTLDAYPTKKPTPDFPIIKHNSSALTTCSYAVFLPNGSMLNGSPANIRVVEGFLAAGTNNAVYTHATSGAPKNYYNITLLASTGRTKVDRP